MTQDKIIQQEAGGKTIDIPRIEPLLLFENNCEAAIKVYQEAFNAELAVMMRYRDANTDNAEFVLKNESEKELIYHAQLDFNGQRIILADNLFDKQPRGHTIYLGAFFKTEAAVRRAFEILSDGATILSVPKSLDYTPCVAGLIDRFGIRWDLMVY